jgi:two-component system KDP operon response regulator KdpE
VAVIVLIEDDVRIREAVARTLEQRGHAVRSSSTAMAGLQSVIDDPPDVVVLDLGLPDLDGVEVVRRIRAWSAMPIVVVSARGQETDKVEALDAGADDYLTKPFGTGELLARMRVALRHSSRVQDSGEPVVEAGGLRIDLGARVVYRDGEEVRLTRTEYRLVAVLAEHAGKVLTHRHLLREVWGPGAAAETHYLRVYMAQLRHKLEDDPARPRHLLTETGVGYRLRMEP